MRLLALALLAALSHGQIERAQPSGDPAPSPQRPSRAVVPARPPTPAPQTSAPQSAPSGAIRPAPTPSPQAGSGRVIVPAPTQPATPPAPSYRRRYRHYHDPFGYDWYGFYHGPSFYWTLRWRDRWWWRHPHYDAWVYWHDDAWWRPMPSGPPAPVTGAPPPGDGTFKNQDGTRMVQLVNGEAFLYDASQTPARFIKRLAGDASQARFSGKTILLDLKNGSFLVFDRDGKRLDEDQAPAPNTAPPPPPPDLKPPDAAR